MPRWMGIDFAFGAAVTLLAGILRFVRLNIPKSLIPLDEFYYPVNALGILRHGADYQLVKDAVLPGVCSQIAIEPVFAVHPPVGKVLIGAGMRLFGCNSFGWRVAAALFGTLTVLLVYLIGRRLFRVPWVAALAALLVAVDGLHFVQSRIAMLDIFLAFFIALAVWLLLEDRARTSVWHTGWRPWRIASGVAIGLGTATKWSAAFVIPILAVIALVWEIERRRRARAITSAPAGGPPDEPQQAAEAEEAGDDGTFRGDIADGTPAGWEDMPGAEDEPNGWTGQPLPARAHFDDAPVDDAMPADEPGDGATPADAPVVGEPGGDEPDTFHGDSADDLDADRVDALPGPGGGPPAPPWQPTTSLLYAAGGPPDVPQQPLPRIRGVGRQIAWLGVTFGLLPILVYLLTYIPWFIAGPTQPAADGRPASGRYTAPRCEKIESNEFGALFNPVNSKVWNLSIWPQPWQEFVCYQREIYDFHKNLKTLNEKGKPSHPYLSRAWSWPWMGRPTSHFFAATGQDEPCEQPGTPKPTPTVTSSGGTPPPASIDPTKPCKIEAEILGLPNPAMWFPAFFLALPLCVWWALRRRDQVAATLLFLFLPLYLPWLITTRPLFLFYMTPAVAILALMVAHMVHRVITLFKPWQSVMTFALMFTAPFTPLYIQWVHAGERAHLLYKVPTLALMFLIGMGLASLLAFSPKPKRLALAYAGLVLALFAYFYPVLAAAYIPDTGILGWRKHMWLQRDCGREQILLTCWI